jgi:thiamine pyridinylase
MFFSEEKNQKTFTSYAGHGLSAHARNDVQAERQKSFGSFLQKRTLLFLLCFLYVPAHVQARMLHVSLYPYIPEAAGAALALKQGFERVHPDVIVEISFNANYYSPDPADKGVLYEDADIHEIDGIFLRDFLDGHRLAKLPASLVAAAPAFESQARQAATFEGRLVAVPHWMCADFLIYRASPSAGADIATLAGLRRSLSSSHGLLMDMKDTGALGELYLGALLSRPGWQRDLATALIRPPDPAVLARFRDILALEPPGFGRNARYARIESFYARQFARGVGAGFVGYSELTHDVLEESANGCSEMDRCVAADALRVAAFPFADHVVRPAIWVDMFGIDARVHGQALADAADFIAYAVSLPAYRALLIPAEGEAPRYLLPATTGAFDDAAIVRAAPLYPRFRAIMEQGVAVTLPLLNMHLHALASELDRLLPMSH